VSGWLVACLCAEWCGSCRDYRAVFDAARARFADGAHLVWIDIEDHPEVLGAIEVEDFPALLIARGDEIVFFGPITPQAATLTRLVEAALAEALGHVKDPRLAGVPGRVRALAG
jgi:thioredoxin 1